MTFAKLLPLTLVLCLIILTAGLTCLTSPQRAETAFTLPAAAMKPQADDLDVEARYERLRAVNEGLERGLLEKIDARRIP